MANKNMIGKPTTPCPKHNVIRIRNSLGDQRCKECDKENAKANLQKKLELGIKPSSCKDCGGERIWNTVGQVECRTCRYKYRREWGMSNKDKLKQTGSEYYKNNKERIAAREKNYREENKEDVKQRRDKYLSSFDKLYWVWKAMNARCHNSNNIQFKDYGDRGIQVWLPWRRDPNSSTFDNYDRYLLYKKYVDEKLGERPDEKDSIDRIDNDKGYEPGNLKWSTRSEQMLNRRVSRNNKSKILDDYPIHHPEGNLTTLKEFAEQVKLPIIVARYRYAQHADAHWILHSEYDNRKYAYQSHAYNVVELSLLSGISYDLLSARLLRGYTAEEAIHHTKHKKLIKDVE